MKMRLNKSILLTLGLALAATFAMAGALLAPVSLTLQNKCTRPVKYEVRGATITNGTIEADGKAKLKLEPGQKVYVDGELCLEVSAKDEGTTYIVCR
jgi:hypothetical protein